MFEPPPGRMIVTFTTDEHESSLPQITSDHLGSSAIRTDPRPRNPAACRHFEKWAKLLGAQTMFRLPDQPLSSASPHVAP